MRVIAGQLGGRRLRAPKGHATRPTAERVREALFDIVRDWDGRTVLDLYAGSGALGIEALSRGACAASFVDSSMGAVEVIRDNLRVLGLTNRATVVPLPLERALGALKKLAPFNRVFCDPPWAKLHLALMNLERLARLDLLSKEATLILEHPARADLKYLEGKGFLEFDRRTYGDSGLSLFTVVAAPPLPGGVAWTSDPR